MSFADEVNSEDQLGEIRQALFRTQEKLAKAKNYTDALVDATILGAKDAMLAMGPIPKVPVPNLRTKKNLDYVEVGLWDTGDWQGAKVTPTYNSEVAQQRIDMFVDEAQSLTAARRATANIEEGVVLFGGDMIEGLFNFPSQAFEIDVSLFGQYVWVSRKVVEVVRRALATYKRVTVSAEWGNHGRIGSKRDNVPKNDNLDRMIFHLAKEILNSEIDSGRLIWPESAEDVQTVEIGNYRALNIHGDEVGRNGFASPATLIRHADRWKSGAFRVDGDFWDFRDVYLHHYHTHAEFPMANGQGSVFQTGSTESDNRYARDSMASSAIPSQRVHFIDPKKGRVTAQHKVILLEEKDANYN
jgi:hypothetical protein